MCEIGRKQEKNRRKLGQLGTNFHFSQSHFSHFSHFSTTSPPFPQVPLMNVASQTSQLEKWEFRDWQTSADFSASADGWLGGGGVPKPGSVSWVKGQSG